VKGIAMDKRLRIDGFVPKCVDFVLYFGNIFAVFTTI
jgi:hypothetical protein